MDGTLKPHFQRRWGLLFYVTDIIWRYLCVICILVIVLFGCAHNKERELIRHAEENPNSYLKKGDHGIWLILNKNGECEIANVREKSPADDAGLKPGDVIIELDDKPIKNRYDVFKIYDGKRADDSVSVVVKRNGQILKKILQFKPTYLPNDLYALMELISKEVPIRLAVVIDNPRSTVPMSSERLGQWRKDYETYIIGWLESMILTFSRGQDKFDIVDRYQTEITLNELHFQSSGVVSNEFRTKIGEILGATHLLVVNLSSDGSVYYHTRRLVEVNSGKTLATVSIKQKISEDSSSKKKKKLKKMKE